MNEFSLVKGDPFESGKHYTITAKSYMIHTSTENYVLIALLIWWIAKVFTSLGMDNLQRQKLLPAGVLNSG